MIFRSKIITILKAFGLYKEFVIPGDISKKFIQLNEAQLKKIQKSLQKNKPRAADFSGHLIERLERFRRTHIPLLIETIGLEENFFRNRLWYGKFNSCFSRTRRNTYSN